jgi:poly(A) polymerase
LSNDQRDELEKLAEPGFAISWNVGGRALRRLFYDHGAAVVRNAALLAWAGILAQTPKRPRAETDGWIAILEAAEAWHRPAFPLRGRDALERGVAAGPDVGRILGAVEEWWEDGDFKGDRDACLAKLDSLIGGSQ